ncbi:hypothetical protein [Moraxella bovis]|uniref:MarR family transcriptional regulator n=1 Tax=Moraxella bovis TaxID=476 RepID=A0ABY6M616_MORBO|nr:hypothetical protein [Moraxella bovis]UZA02936.1 hypothetical protein LP092_13525 [Moraxella bovis]UZA19152.1 hypothetical protein LP088_12790 [Moraxella bovis]UZA54029.1 hypothetical protein LP111_12740 [Moraxella bovis]UZA57365.1 hypothetical protein LP127_01435 [Moraxella bovis]
MTVKLNQKEINWIANEFQNDRTVQEIAIDTGMSVNNVKRALAEKGLISLSWYKTTDEIQMLNYLKAMGINNLIDLKGVL